MKTPIVWAHARPEDMTFMRRRVVPMIQHYGNNVMNMTLETLCFSVYTQALLDYIQLTASHDETDFQI